MRLAKGSESVAVVAVGWRSVLSEVEPGEDRFVEHLACLVGGGVVEVACSAEEFEYGAAGLDALPQLA